MMFGAPADSPCGDHCTGFSLSSSAQPLLKRRGDPNRCTHLLATSMETKTSMFQSSSQCLWERLLVVTLLSDQQCALKTAPRVGDQHEVNIGTISNGKLRAL